MSLFISKKSDGLGKMLGIGLVIFVVFVIKFWSDIYGYLAKTTILTRDQFLSSSVTSFTGMFAGLALMGLSMWIRKRLARNRKSDEQS